MEQESGSPGKGQTLTEQILQIMEVILMEASSETPEKYKVRKNGQSLNAFDTGSKFKRDTNFQV